ncbi:replication protein A 32 kDa subunit-like [Engraulis encrasicolus]|uniref:replication protein A 32 kDa subunit-like n=1 Tax=Engraulis encrasicolus TaxID=184585 RepID=UPI002FCF76F6
MGSEGYGYHGRYQAKGGFYSSPEQQTRTNRSNALALTPCSVSQLRRAVEGPNGFTCGGTDLNMVSVVGLVRAVSSTSVSCVIYLLDDMTGPPIQAKFWTEEGDVENCVHPGTYVRVIGRIRSFESRRLVSGLHIRRLEDLNEITSHILEVVHAHMTYSPGSQPNAHMTCRPGHSQAILNPVPIWHTDEDTHRHVLYLLEGVHSPVIL